MCLYLFPRDNIEALDPVCVCVCVPVTSDRKWIRPVLSPEGRQSVFIRGEAILHLLK